MSTGARMRVYEIAREVGIPNKDLIMKIRAMGLEVNNHMSSLDADDVDRVKRSIENERLANTVTQRLSSTVLRRRSKRAKVADAAKVEAPKTEAPVAEPSAAEPSAAEPSAAEVPAATEAPKPAVRRRVAAKPVAEPETEATPPAVEPAAPADASAPAAPAAPAQEPPAEPAPEAAPEPAPAPPVAAEAPAKPVEPAADEPAAEAAVAPAAPAAGDDPRSRFERELELARQRAAAREAERQRKKQEELALSRPRPDGRPEVGSVISLPMTRIKITERAPTPQEARRRFQPQERRGGRRAESRHKRKAPPGKKGKATQITTPAEHKRVIKIEDSIAVQDLAKQMGIKATELLRKLWSSGMVGVNINATIDFETANIIASEFGYEVQNVAFQEEAVLTSAPDPEEALRPRPAVVTVMGHVDHGKTTLLDAIRNSRVAAGEAGGITQHIAAYRVPVPDMGELVFLDTPGHAAFTQMRARGAQVTDIVVLVCAADDGVMPQTIEALSHAKDAGVPIIVAVNKIDAPNAQPERVRQQLAEHELIPEEWGGDTQYVEISALKKLNIDKLLEAIALQAELLELKANPDKPASGVVIEARLDRARGPVATALVQQGTLHVGDIVVAGEIMGKVRAMLDDKGDNVKEAGPSMPVEILGLDGVPDAGDTFHVTDEKTAKRVVEHRRDQKRKKELAASSKLSLENIMEKIQTGDQKELKVVLKADVQGSAEALKDALQKLSTEKVSVNVISAGVGGITETDVNLAKAGGAIIVGFHVRPAGKAAKHAEQEGVEIKLYNVIYEALDEVKAAMAGLLAPIKKEKEVGKLEVRQTFNISKVGTVAGCYVTEGKIQRKSLLRVIRDSVQVYEGRVGQLKRFKDDVNEVDQGYECGLMIDGFNDIQVGDIVEAYEIVEEAATLE
ncbi:MAG: translation initiation factor IF-2 [Deltaproteobacteria bacterium]|nr:MAG: translation initiation factor IF-2 [Deltaproteobacteria bacterium]